MSVLRFFTDTHLGRELKANTTPASRALLSSQLYEHAMIAATLPYEEGGKVHFTVCGGDLFDTDHNEEAVLIQGSEVARRCELVLGGNHDVVNISGRESSLSALAKLTRGDNFILPPSKVGQHSFSHYLVHEAPDHVGDVMLYAIPHHARQQEFERALDEALQDAQRYDKAAGRVRRLLLVHCNYHLTMEAGENDLNLTDAKARQLLQTFDFIVMGHDHRPRRECDNRVIILGNTHPTCFSDLGEKFVWFYNSEMNEFHRQLLAPDCSQQIEASQLIDIWRDGEFHRLADVEWLDLTGELPPEAAVDLAKAVRAAYKEIPYLYALRASKVRFTVELEEGVEVAPQQLTLLELVEADLGKTPELLELFREAKEARE